MRRTTTIALIGLVCVPALAQVTSGSALTERMAGLHAQGARFARVELFRQEEPTSTRALWNAALEDATVLALDPAAAAELTASAPPYLTLQLPGPDGGRILELERVEITSDDFTLRLAGRGVVQASVGLHYRGVVQGAGGSLAAISIAGDEVMGLVADASGDHVLGRLEGGPAGLHVLYNDDDLRARSNAACHTDDAHAVGGAASEEQLEGASRTTRCVRLYWEVRYQLFQAKGGMANTVAYMTGLFNQSATLFANDDIDVTLSELFVWDESDPYSGSSTSGLLDQFGEERTSFNGDLAHLIGTSGGGGIAWLNTLCNGQTRYRMAYSAIQTSYANVPTYSWSVEVITHEQGHNMGSQHTHACAWNGNNTAIDGCGPEAGYDEGCDGPLPPSSVGGTIMSYCHLTSSTIKFANGFGPQPTARITARVNAANCLATCGTSCDPPAPITISQITQSTAMVSWPSTGALAYDLQWKASSSGTWTDVAGLTAASHQLGGLVPATSYDVRVRSVCGTGSSAWSTTTTFSSATVCPDAHEPNNTFGTAATIAVPSTVDALIASNSDQDYYTFVLAAPGDIQINLTSLPADYDLRLLNAAGTELADSEQGGTTSESITYPGAPAGTYGIHVYGWNGAHSTFDCYALAVFATGQTCLPPVELWASDITYASATLNWMGQAGSGGTWDLQWRRTTDNWTTVSGVSATTYPLGSLLPATDHEFRVRQACLQGTSGAYSEPVPFTTLAAPCEVAPPALISLRVLLDGPYRTSDGLMTDSLRSKGLLPLQEPYTAMGFAINGPVTTAPSVLTGTGATAVVDWVIVELRDPQAPANVVERRVGLVQRNGWVVRPDGSFGLPFCATGATYHVAVRHRNHLGLMTATPRTMSPTGITLDFPASPTTYGTQAQKQVNGTRVLWAGNTLGDGSLLYTGSGNDRDPILQAVGGVVPTSTVTGYRFEDVDLDGVVRYTGANNDRDRILQNIGGVVPTSSRDEQLP